MIRHERRRLLEAKVWPHVQTPGQYVGGERNIVVKDHRTLKGKLCLGFPDAYTIGMSHHGLQVLYSLMNRRDDWCAERVFAPSPDMEKRLRDLNATKDKFFSIIAQDRKNPFNSTLGFGELLLSEYDYYSDEEKKTYISLINNISENTFILLQNLLEWARSQTGALEYKPVKTDLCTEINSVIQLLLPDAKKKDIVLFSGVLYNTPVFADRDMLSTILRNLVSNAIKFSANGSKVRILAETDGRFQKITVIDNGVGISEATIPKLFKIEEKVSTPGTQNEKGTGLGLLLCKEFVEKMGGKIWVESNPGQGSRFYFTIPAHQF